MRDKKIVKRLQSNNKGAAMVTVIVVIAFICVLTTLLLYLSVMNYQMKSTDYKTKVSFYGAEIPLEELRVCLAEDMSVCAQEAYRSVMSQFSALESEPLRRAEYEKIMWENMQEIWNDRRDNPFGNDAVTDPNGWCHGVAEALLEDYNSVQYPKRYHVILDDGTGTVLHCGNEECVPYHIIIQNLGDDQFKMVVDDTDPNKSYMSLKGIKVSYTEDSFSSVISTEFCMNMPKYDWSVDESSRTGEAGEVSAERTQILYERCVVYMNYMKQ